MKKIFLFPLLLISLSFGISSVKADTSSLSSYSDTYDNDVTFYLSHQTQINNLIQIWEEYFSMQYPYYYVVYDTVSNSSVYFISLIFSSNSVVISGYNGFYTSSNLYNNGFTNYIQYRSDTDSTIINPTPGSFAGRFGLLCPHQMCSPVDNPAEHSLPLINHGFKLNDSPFSTLQFNGFTSTTYNQTFSTFYVDTGDLFPDVVSLYNGTYTPEDTDVYEEINLNNYEYILLTLKSYTPIDTQYYTKIYTEGSLCATPVYNYGMTEKNNYYEGYQVQGCTEYYTSYTPVNFYILPQDVSNHVVYYVKSSNSYVTNKIKVDTDIFDITYVTSSNSSNPSVTINGRSYPVIPYNDLTDTAIISTNEGYISGQVCAIGDVNCYYEATGIDISDIFSSPLQVLESVWSSIATMFTMIFGFYSLLPPVLRTFMTSAFMLAVTLGIIKIILG